MKNKSILLLILLLMGSFMLSSSAIGGSLEDIYRNNVAEGYFIKAENNRIYFEDYDGTNHNIAFNGNTTFNIDNRNVGINDFKKGMEVYIELKDRTISYMDSFSTDFPGNITPGTKQRTGIVKVVDRDQIIVKTAIGTEETYFTSPATVTLKNNQNVSLNTLYVGDRVKLFFDDIDTSFVSKIQIEGSSILIKDLYRGVLGVTNRMSDVITLNNVEVFRNGNWENVGTLKLPYNSELPLYVAGQKIDYRNIGNYRGKTVYMAMKDSFGKDKVEKMIIKNQYETTFSEKIESVSWFTSEMKLSNTRRNIGFNDGTMVIKNGRLVDSYSITPNSSGLIVADGRGRNSTADVVYIYDEDINNSNIGMDQIYAGRLDNIYEYELDLKDFFVLNKNEWESFAKIKGLYYDNETFIYDSENKKILTAEELLAGQYAVDEDSLSYEDKKHNRRDWYAYIYTDGDRIAAIHLRKDMDSLLRQTVSTAYIEKAPFNDKNAGMSISIRDVKDWSNRQSKWTARQGSFNLRISDILIMKDGKRISYEDLKPNDRLYIVRDDLVGKIIIVK